MKEIKTGIYRHFKGNYYYVEGLVISSETNEKYVLYMGINGTRFIRPLSMFNDEIDIERNDNQARQRKRFEIIHGLENKNDRY